jgi:3'-5' exoribonuclease
MDLLRHFILSHHGVPEFGAIRQPMTAEALALHYIDNLDAKLAAFFRATTQHPIAGDNWTAFQKMFDTYLYRGNVFGENAGSSSAADSGEGAGPASTPPPSLF